MVFIGIKSNLYTFRGIILYMSIETPPVQRLFDLQRKYVEQSVENVKRVVEAHKETVDKVDIETPIEAYNRSLEAGKTLSDSYFDAIEEVLPNEVDVEKQQEIYDEAYDVFQQGNKKAEKVFKQNLENVLEVYIETVDENVKILDEQVDVLLEGLDEVESQTVQTVEQTKEVVEVEE